MKRDGDGGGGGGRRQYWRPRGEAAACWAANPFAGGVECPIPPCYCGRLPQSQLGRAAGAVHAEVQGVTVLGDDIASGPCVVEEPLRAGER
eukprot:COSAG05_NODE_74_length_21769_cov_194.316290_20_plen_91_part_00